jgi:hypothetical protein
MAGFVDFLDHNGLLKCSMFKEQCSIFKGWGGTDLIEEIPGKRVVNF